MLEFISVEAFASQGHGLVQCGHAPDGLPLVARIQPPPSAAGLLSAAANALGVEDPSSAALGLTPMGVLLSQLDELLRHQHRRPLEVGPGRIQSALVIPMSVTRFTGPTLLERVLLGVTPKYHGTYAGFGRNPPASTLAHAGLEDSTQANVLNSVEDFVALASGQAFMAVSQGELMIVTRRKDAHGWPTYAYERSFQQESLRGLSGATLCGQGGVPGAEITASSFEEYAMRRAAAPHGTWRWRVPRIAVARAILGAARALSEMHSGGRVHGDVKPSNLLITQDRVVAFDDLGLVPGQRAHAMTQGWAASEQILGQPVSVQTDQYAIGIMLLTLTQGVLFGEETRVSTPVGGRQLRHHTLFRNPHVYIDPRGSCVEASHLDAWRALLERCVKFEASERFESMDALALELERLCEAESLRGDLSTPLTFGGSLEATSPGVCWLVS